MDKPSNAFATDEAADIIIAGIESGAIGFPFLQAFNQERFPRGRPISLNRR